MSNVKISQLTSAGSLTGTEVLPIVQSGTTYKTAVQNIANLVVTSSFITTGSASLTQRITGSLIVSSSLRVTGSVNITGSLLLNGLPISGINTSNFITTGSATSTQSITGSLIVSSSLRVTGSVNITGSLLLNGSPVGGAIDTSNFITTGSTSSTQVITGSLLVSSSLAVTGSINVQGAGTYTGNVSVGTFSNTQSISINSSNENFINVAGVGSHIILANDRKNSGQSVITSINDTNLGYQTKGKIRFDLAGNINYAAYDDYVRGNSTGSHIYYVGGDFGTGSVVMTVGDSKINMYRGADITGSVNITGSLSLNGSPVAMTSKVVLTPTDLTNMDSVQIIAVPTPPAGKVIYVTNIAVRTDSGTGYSVSNNILLRPVGGSTGICSTQGSPLSVSNGMFSENVSTSWSTPSPSAVALEFRGSQGVPPSGGTLGATVYITYYLADL